MGLELFPCLPILLSVTLSKNTLLKSALNFSWGFFCFSFCSEILLSSLDSPLPLSVMYLTVNMIMEELDQLCKLSWKKQG